jgi:hypothetical protein
VSFTITRIPERYQPGLAKINSLPLGVIEKIADSLGTAVSPTGIKELRSCIEKAADITTEEADALVTSLHSLYVFMAGSEAAVSEFVPVLVGAMERSGRKALTVGDDRTEITEKLIRLLSLKTMERASKIEQLKSDHQAIFYDAKVLSDIRPLFDQPDEAPIGAVIQHTLKLVFHEGSEHKELYMALDSQDLEILRKISERAELKAASLEALIKAVNIPDLS